MIVGGGIEPEAVQAGFSSAGLASLLGVSPALGRFFEEEEVRRAQPVAVISHMLWHRRFGGSTDVIGMAIEIDDKSFTVVGVMPAAFRFPARETQLWLPITTNRYWLEPTTREDLHSRGFFMRWNIVARLHSAISARDAQNYLRALTAQLQEQDRSWNMGLPVKVSPLAIELEDKPRLALVLLLGAVTLLLLIACTNVANLLLARGAERTRELAIRLALSASRSRIVQQILIESLLLTSAAIAVSLFLAMWAIPLLISSGPADLPRLEETKLDLPVLAFAAGVSLLVAFGLAVVLATSAGLLLRSLWQTHSVDLGYDPARILTMRLQPATSSPPSQREAFYDRLHERITSIPGVQNLGGIRSLFELGAAPTNSLRVVEGKPAETNPGRPLTWTVVSGEYFQAMGIPLLIGRLFSGYDGRNAGLVAVIDESMAKRYWPRDNPIGQCFKCQDRRGRDDARITVVGLVRDERRPGRRTRFHSACILVAPAV